MLIRPNEIKDHYPKFFGQMKQALFSVRHSYFPKAEFEKIALNIGKSVAYITQQQLNRTSKQHNQPRRLGGFQGLGDFQRVLVCIGAWLGRTSYQSRG